ncbi:hypothetical protein BDZ97DRAFT_1760206 [Flammula alnicola]|nr:hypothetical protein BDZ97DRAFT_1760206 [Flammula alnicola]
MIPSRSTGIPPHFTYDQILYSARLVQQVRGTTLNFVAADVQEETIQLPNDIRLVDAFQRLDGEAVAGMVVHITRSPEGGQGPGRGAFAVTIVPYAEKATTSETKTNNKKPEEEEKPHEYHVFDDYLTSFVWAASSDGLKDEVLDDDLPTVLTSALADDVRRWTDTYDTNFRLQGCDQGSGLDVFPTVAETITWTIEGAILSARMAVATSVPVVYSAYLRQGNEYRFVGDAAKDAASLVGLALRLNKHLAVVQPVNPETDGILRLRN